MESKDGMETSAAVEVMETDLGNGSVLIQDITTLDSIEVELDKIQEAGGDSGTSVNSMMVLNAATQVSNETSLPGTSSVVRVAGTSSSLGLAPATAQQQSNTSSVVTLQNSQVLLSSVAQSGGGTAAVHSVRRASGSDGAPGQTVTRMIITKNTAGQQVQSAGLGPHTPAVIVTTTASATSLLSQPKTPTKAKETFRVVMSNTGVFSPQKILTTPSTPTKQIIPAGKVPITPLKTPPKITMVPIAKSPQKGLPGQPQIITMVGKTLVSGTSGSATVNMTTAKGQPIPLSPSKVIIKGQHANLAQQPPAAVQSSVVAQQLSAPTQLKPGGVVSSSTVQPLTVSGNKFQYVRLVNTPATQSHTTTVKAAAIAPAPTASIAKSAASMGPIKIMPVNQAQQQIQRPTANPTLTSVLNQNQRVILPATSQVSIRPSIQPQTPTFAQIRPGPAPGGASNTLNQLPPGTTIISSGQNVQGVQGFALVPAQYVPQLQQQFLQQQSQQKSDDLAPGKGPLSGLSHARHNGAAESGSSRQRKPCNCTKSQCLKLYCDCFANGEFCNDCNCMNCYNNLDHEEERSRAIKSCLERNPQAFHPKIGKGKGKGDRDRRHNKGCNCKKSGCLKNYCECYEAKILCSTLCKCCGCKNFEESPDRKTLMHLADAAEVRVKQQTAATTKLSSQIRDLPPRAPPSTSGERPAYSFMTTEVAEATCHCLIAQAEEAERTRQIEITQERMILEEFGRCLMQVIESANKTKLGVPPSLP